MLAESVLCGHQRAPSRRFLYHVLAHYFKDELGVMATDILGLLEFLLDFSLWIEGSGPVLMALVFISGWTNRVLSPTF